MKCPHSLTVLILTLLFVSGCDHKIELTGPVILKEAPKPKPKPKPTPTPTPTPEAKKIEEVCIGGVFGAKNTHIRGTTIEGIRIEASSEKLSPREAEGTINDCLMLGFQPIGEWVVLPGAKSHYPNSHYPPSAFMMFVKYEGDP